MKIKWKKLALITIPCFLLGFYFFLNQDFSGETNAQKKVRIEESYSLYSHLFTNVPITTPAQVIPRLEDPHLLLVDVREPHEQEISQIPGAITKKQFQRILETDPEKLKNKEIITYCTVGARSGIFAKTLKEKNLNVFNLKGSLLSWSHENGPLVDSKGEPTKKIHVHAKRWDLVPEDFEGVY